MTNNIVPSIIKSYKGRAIRIREDKYVCLTDMAIASGKLFANWHQLKSTSAYLAALSPVIGIPITELVEVAQGGTPEEQGTWAHPKVAIKFAAWCSPQFEVQVTIWIDELLNNGSVSIAPAPIPQLPSRELALETAVAIDRIQDILSKSNPRLAQILIDCAMNDIVDFSRSTISATQEFPEDRWHGLVQIASKMGIKTDSSSRVKLGQYIGKLIKSGKLDVERVREERLCNGQYEEIWCYRDNETVRNAIREWSIA